jgi:GNAT superfamily N-acetyltransferase
MSTFSGILGMLPRGYRIGHEVHGEPEEGDGYYRIVVTYAGDEVGAMMVRIGENGWEPHVEVLRKHQRKGLGSAMWRYAEKLVGELLEPGLEATEAGQRLIDKMYSGA